MSLNNKWVNNEIKGKKSYLKSNDEPTTTQSLWDTTKAVLRGKFATLQAYLEE